MIFKQRGVSKNFLQTVWLRYNCLRCSHLNEIFHLTWNHNIFCRPYGEVLCTRTGLKIISALSKVSATLRKWNQISGAFLQEGIEQSFTIRRHQNLDRHLSSYMVRKPELIPRADRRTLTTIRRNAKGGNKNTPDRQIHYEPQWWITHYRQMKGSKLSSHNKQGAFHVR